MKELLLVAVVALIHGTSATLVIKGPAGQILEGEPVKLECLYMDSDLNVTQVHFEFQHPGSRYWHRIWGSSLQRYFCFYRSWSGSMEEEIKNTRLLDIPFPMTYSGGAFRCVSNNENVTAPDDVSQPLTFKVQYLSEPSLYAEDYSWYPSTPEQLVVWPGDDVVVECFARSSEEPNYYWSKEGSDWILPSSTLTVKNMSVQDEGQYTCVVEHPSVKSLNKKHTINITLLSEDDAWLYHPREELWGCYLSFPTHWLTISAVAVSLLVFILSLTVCLRRRAKRIRTSKGPIDDRSQKKPIYKTSVESLPSTCADNQPLV